MFKHCHQIIVLIPAIFLIAACTFTTQPETSPTEIPATITLTDPAPTNIPVKATETETPVNPTPTLTGLTDKEEISDIQENSNNLESNIMIIKIGDKTLTATLADNSSANALKEALAKGPITVNMQDYGSMEKVGSLGMNLPKNDEQITTEAGDIILYQGNAFVIYYAPNSWNFTRLGKIDNITAQELKKILGNGNVTVTLSLE